jgi:tetrahydromethanopterin S-methyltransferase subunit G
MFKVENDILHKRLDNLETKVEKNGGTTKKEI